MYTMYKTFDFLDIPENIRNKMIDDFSEKSRESYYQTTVENNTHPLNIWLLENGAILNEDILILIDW